MKFHTTVMRGGKTATGLVVPDAVVEALGTGRRPKVTVTLNGYSYRTSVATMHGQFVVSLSAEHRTAAGVAAGDQVEVTIALDDAPRVVEVPADLAAAFDAAPAAREFFDHLAYTHRKEWVRWIEDAKKPETRQARLERTVAGLIDGKRAR